MWHDHEIQSAEEGCDRQLKYMENKEKSLLRGKSFTY